MLSDSEKNVSNVTPEDLEFIYGYARLPADKKMLMNGIVIGLNYNEDKKKPSHETGK